MAISGFNVIIVSSNKEYCEILKEYLKGYNDFNIDITIIEELECIELVKEKVPCLMILDLEMGTFDEFAVIEKIDSMDMTKKVKLIVLSNKGYDAFLQSLISYGIEYCTVDPFKLSILAEKVLEIYNASTTDSVALNSNNTEQAALLKLVSKDDPFVEKEIINIIDEIGIPYHLKGYSFIRDAITMLMSMPVNDTALLLEVIYFKIADKYHTTPQRIERGIKYAVEVSTLKENQECMIKLFGHMLTNNSSIGSEFINYFADIIKYRKHI